MNWSKHHSHTYLFLCGAHGQSLPQFALHIRHRYGMDIVIF